MGTSSNATEFNRFSEIAITDLIPQFTNQTLANKRAGKKFRTSDIIDTE